MCCCYYVEMMLCLGCCDDYYLEFGEDCSPDELLLGTSCFSGKKRGYALEDGRILRLKHSLFEIDGVFLHRAASSVTLKSDKSDRSVTVRYPDMPYVGFWHAAKTDAPYVCIEPWCGLGGIEGVEEELATRSDMFRLQPGRTKTVWYSMTFQ